MEADMMLAVICNDQTNLVAGKLAATLSHTPLKIARVRTADFLARPELFSAENFAGHWFRLIPISPLNSFDLFFGSEQHSLLYF
jgi:Trk K+ transport system NAD-binding subunit